LKIDNSQLTIKNLARTLVQGKINNGRALILRYQRNYPEQTFEAELKTLDDSIKKLGEQKSGNSIMGLEGIGTATYFKAFGQMFKKSLVFEKRTRRPPKDPVNAVLSLGYTMLTNEIYSLLDGAGFDPYIGFLHEIDYGRASLALDLTEEFRQPLIDRFTLFLFNNEILADNDFRPVEGEGIYLTNDAMKTFFQKYEHRMRESFTSKRHDEKQTTFRDLIRNQVQKLIRTIKFNEPYRPFHLRD
jgi:CRISPR-associated protein Cas1